MLQSYLFRSENDLRQLLPVAPNLRIVKGAYLEPPDLAFPAKRDVDANYLQLAELALSHDGYTAIATHDPKMIAHVEAFAAARGLPKRGRFEFQMLFGIAETLAAGIGAAAAIGCASRFRTASFGFRISMRRLAERPANLAFFCAMRCLPR